MSELETEGVITVERAIPQSLISLLRGYSDTVTGKGPGSRAVHLPSDISLLVSPDGELGSLACSLGDRDMRPARILFFDKTPESNWAVPWHQDRTIAVKEKHDVRGFGPWSLKNGVVHVEPPVDILEDMLTLRLFIDDCGENNGPLEVARGSHLLGRIPADQVKAVASTSSIFLGTGHSADVLAMKLLAVHRSKRAATAEHRRVLHVDYASKDLPPPLAWAL